MDLGGLGNASGGSPGNGGARGIASDVETCNSGIQNGSGASAAPQQAMPAASPQQLPPQAVRTPAAPVAELRAVLRTTVTATLLATVLAMVAACLVRVHVRRRRRGLRCARPLMSMAVMSPRQRRHGNSRDQNDRRHNAHKLYVHKPYVQAVGKLLQAHRPHLSQEPTAAKQLWLIAAVTNPAASRRVCALPTRRRCAQLQLRGIGERNSGVVHVIPNYDGMSSGRLLSKTAMLGATTREIRPCSCIAAPQLTAR